MKRSDRLGFQTKMRSHPEFLWPALVALTICAISSAQTPPTNSQTSAKPTATPRIVKLSFMVVDRSNHAVDDLKKEEIRLFEDKLPQTINSFSRAEKAVDYGLVIDVSGSFKTLLPAVLKAASLLIENEGPADQCFIESFSNSEQIVTAQEFTLDKVELKKGLDSLYIRGGQSAVIDAIYLAVEHVAKRPASSDRRRALVLFTDGEDRASYYEEKDLVKLIRASGVQLFVIGLLGELDNRSGLTRPSAREHAQQLLTRIAKESGGRVFLPKTSDDLVAALREVFHDLHIQYEIGYESLDANRDDFHSIKIELADSPNRRDATVVAPPGYFLIPPDLDSKDKKKSKKP